MLKREAADLSSLRDGETLNRFSPSSRKKELEFKLKVDVPRNKTKVDVADSIVTALYEYFRGDRKEADRLGISVVSLDDMYVFDLREKGKVAKHGQ